MGAPDAAFDQAPPPKMLVSPTLLDYGSPYVGGEYAKTFTIANVGVADLTVTTLNLIEDRTNGAFKVTAPSVPFVVPGSQTETITVTLKPNDGNLPTGSIKIHSDDPDSATADATVDLVSHVKGSALLGVCVINDAPPPDCVLSGDGNPLIDYGTLDYGTSAARVVSLVNAGDGNLPVQITKVSIPVPDHFTVTLFEAVDDTANPGQKIEQPATLPFFLSIGDPTASPPLPATELRVHVQFTATGIDGDVPHESLVVEYNLTDSPTSIPIVGHISGCMPTPTDAGVPDGGADPNTDPNNCGACGNKCSTTILHATVVCSYGQCGYTVCDSNWGDCDHDATNGCETDLRTSLQNCGACGAPCSNTNATGSTCSNGACTAPTCTPSNFGNCDGNNANGCETDLSNTVTHCGACSTACTQIAGHGTTRCANFICAPTCAPGFKDCDGDPNNGCETGVLTDINNCGDCLKVCDASGGTTSCVGGICHPGCDQGYGDCDGNPANGCETDILTSVTNCGGCGSNFTCSSNNIPTRTCTGGVCDGACAAGFADCDGNKQSNGCEADLKNDPNNCGGCNRICSGNNMASRTCVNGVCSGTCIAGYADCDNDKFTNGCEVELATDANNCGACNAACSNTHMATRLCGGGQCIGACATGYADCNGDKRNDGCEADLQNDPYTCGGCNNNCSSNNMATKTCTTGVCSGTCVNGFADCDGNKLSNGCEADLSNDPNTCGACNKYCSANHMASRGCTAGVCDGTCAVGYADCNNNKLSDGCEADLNADADHCGGCTNVCSSANMATRTCSGGVCSGTCASGYADCDGNKLTNGCEINTNTNADNCGACSRVCSNNHMATRTCGAGTCNGTCATGYSDCNADKQSDGCEINTAADVSHCGTCTKVCSSTNGTATCTTGTCGITCSTGYGNCDNNADNGCEVNLKTDVGHCGVCTKACNGTNGTASCTNGLCGITCTTGFADCDNNVDTGCEINLNTSVPNCGGCGQACSTANGTASCSSGTCSIVCNANYANCDNDARSNGCEVSLQTDPLHCNTCTTVCNSTNGTATCTTGSCGINCLTNWGNCDGLLTNGCEADLKNDPNHCGTCTTVCNASGGTPSCNNGTCGITCTPPMGDCDGNTTNGCETNLNTSLANCGGCSQPCSTANGSATCSTGVCSITCNAGYGDCNSNPRLDGCETNLGTSVANCGGCGQACSSANGTASCSGGNCSIVCSTGWGNCDGNARTNGCETNTTNTVAHCGACNQGCSSANGTASCANSQCAITCNTGYANCDGNARTNGCEINLLNDVNNCGSCGNVCSSNHGTPSCVNGTCQIACSTGWGNCDGNVTNGCETDLNSTLAHCGGCGQACSTANGTASCSSGNCSIVCNAGYGNCDNNARTNGCEVNLNTSVANCGACGAACSTANGAATCNAGGCYISCNAGWGNCDNNARTNGCETNLNTSVGNCGGCGAACSSANGTASCSTGNCAIACSSGYGNCDGDARTNGCETNLNTSTGNCGTCGHDCASPMPSHASSVGCSSGACTVTGCQGGYYNPNGSYSDGCECAADGMGKSCAGPTNVGTIAVDVNPAVSVTANLTPTTSDTDWYVVTFAQNYTCNFGPKITITGDAVARFHVYTNCSAGIESCTEGGNSGAMLTSWEFTYQSGITYCGAFKTYDPYGGDWYSNNPRYFVAGQPYPVTLYVQVVSTGTTTTCAPYTLTFSN